MTTPVIRPTALLSLALLGATLPTSTRADAMKPWSGASATSTNAVDLPPTTSTSAGATASTAKSWNRPISYYPPNRGPEEIFWSRGLAIGKAGESADKLLQTSVSAEGVPNFTAGTRYDGSMAAATAGWKEDAVLLTPPAAGAMPDTIRLNFQLNFTTSSPNDGNRYGDLTLTANDKAIRVHGADASGDPGYKASDFDTLADDPDRTALNWRQLSNKVGTFHIDLPVNANGVSDPFSLRLSTSTKIWTDQNDTNNFLFGGIQGVLSLDSVTLPDGTSLAEKGYGVAFASGLAGLPSAPSPRPIPEPATVATWALVAAAGLGLARKRAGR